MINVYASAYQSRRDGAPFWGLSGLSQLTGSSPAHYIEKRKWRIYIRFQSQDSNALLIKMGAGDGDMVYFT